MPHQQILSYPPAKRPSDLCSVTFLRYALFSFNTILMLTGLALLAFGVWTLLEKSYMSPLLPPLFTISVYTTCVIGAMVLSACAIGCQGAIQEKQCSMVTFTVMLVLIFLLEVATGVISYLVYTSITKSAFSVQLTDSGVLPWTGQNAASEAMDDIQIKYKCCGAEDYTDWQQNSMIRLLNTSTPDSCCITPVANCGRLDHPSNLNREGCAKYIEEDINLNIIMIPALNLGFCVIQIFGVVFSCAFTRQLSRSRRFKRRRFNY